MKTLLKIFSAVPWSVAVVLMCVAFLNGCSDEPVSVSRPGGSSPIVSADAENSEMMRADKRTFNAHLTGDQERPTPVTTDGSGQAIFTLSKDGTELHYKVIVNNLENITQAHIHCGGPEVAGPVVAFLFGFVAGGVTVNGVLAEGVITAANVIARPDTEACMGGVANFNQLIAKIRAGQAYINVHTVAFPPGEIRGLIR